MKKFSLTALGRRHLETASCAGSGRSASTVYGGHEHVLRQTVIALKAGQELNEHVNPGEATVLVMSGKVSLSSRGESWEGSAVDLLVVPQGFYAVEALEDSVLVLTVAKTDRGPMATDQSWQDKARGKAGRGPASTPRTDRHADPVGAEALAHE
ncbi:MAG: LuxR family transcriptional regulator [Arthrobacter sp.]|uniref:LuxR family transcriptional regulator n=1 Tax=unclassified Arthrobacter TaxID=235627 RepID=UPI003FB77FDD